MAVTTMVLQRGRVMNRTAQISPCGFFRYSLGREWDPSKSKVLFIGLNPSTADEQQEDRTSLACIRYAQRWGYGRLEIGNLFAFRSTNPSGLYLANDPVGPDNDIWLEKLQSDADLVVCAWGNGGSYMGRDKAVLGYLKNTHCLVKLKNGAPGHPLYKRASLLPIPFP